MLKRKKTLLIICLSFSACQLRTLETTQKYIDLANSKCYGRSYRFSRDFVGPRGDLQALPLESCDDMLGYGPDEYVEVKQWLEDLRQSKSVK